MASETKHVDVVVVGAGLSGLQCAVSLQDAGVSILVLEARDRVGGKTWSREFAGGVSDMGAAWINDTNQSSMYALAKRFGLETITQNTEGAIVMHDLDGSAHAFPYGGIPEKDIEKGGVENMIKLRDLFESECQKIDIVDPVGSGKKLGFDYDGMNMSEFVVLHGGKETALCTVSIWTRAMLGLEPEEVSALFFLCYCKSGGGLMRMRSDRRDGGQFLRIATGTQSFSHGLTSLLAPESIILNSPVTNITYDSGTTTVTTAKRRKFTCDRVVVSLPTTLYKTIEFNPPLPPSKLKLASNTLHGHTSKVLLAYKEPWWRAAGFCGLTQSLKGLVQVTRDTSNDKVEHYSLLCFLVGEPGRRWSKLSSDMRRRRVIEHIDSVFRYLVKEVPEPIEVIEQIWSDEEFSAGCPCPAMPPGLLTEMGSELRLPHGKVHFIGTETAFEWRGYMEGAVRSGERGAKEVLKALGRGRL